MSKDLDYIENCLENMSKGNFYFYVNTDVLKKSNSAGRMARYIKLIVDNENRRLEILREISQGNFNVAAKKSDSSDRIGDIISEICAKLSKIRLQLEDINGELSNGNKDIRFFVDKYQGGFKAIGNSLNQILDNILLPLGQTQNAVKAMSVNDFSVSVDDTGALKGLNNEINNLRERLKSFEDVLVKLSYGDFSAADDLKENGQLSENDNITPALINLADSLRLLPLETHYIAENCAQGKIFETRGDTEKFEGAAKAVVEDINKVLDTVSAAVRQSTDAITALAERNCEAAVENDLPGDFGGLSSAIDRVSSRMAEIKALSQKVAQGKIGDIDLDTGEQTEQDEIKSALLDVAKNMRSLINETCAMKKAFESGDLLYRIDTSSAAGEYAAVLENFNEVCKLASGPLLRISDSLQHLALGKAKDTIDETYTGVFEKLRTSVNTIIKRNKALVETITSCLTKIASGNLDIDKIEDFAGDWNCVSAALNNIVDSLNKSVSSIYNAVDEVAEGATQVAVSSQNISRGAADQAGSIEELTTSIAQVASQTQLNATNAGKANSLAKEMSERAAAGSKEINEMLESMQEINDSTKNISKIIKVIDDIAFQTNILALNAAVEAAHAGANGKGFAVVAEEVRNLAARSANAVKDTTELIKGSINSVEKGTSIAKDTAKTFGNIIEGVDKVAEIVDNIAAASNEQANNITEINQALERISKVVQSDSTTAEQGAAASAELSKQAGILKSSVQKFKLSSKAVNSAGSEKVSAKKDTAAPPKTTQYTRKPSDNFFNDFGKY